MKNLMFLFVCVACLLTNAAACTTNDNPQSDQTTTVWDRYNVGSVLFEDKAPETAGSDIYRRIIPRPESYIKEQARTVLATLYTSPKDSIPRVYQIHYTLEDIEGVSAKSGGNGYVSIFYSRRTAPRTDTRLPAGAAGSGQLRRQPDVPRLHRGHGRRRADSQRRLRRPQCTTERRQLHGRVSHDRLLPRVAARPQRHRIPAQVQPECAGGRSLVVRRSGEAHPGTRLQHRPAVA